MSVHTGCFWNVKNATKEKESYKAKSLGKTSKKSEALLTLLSFAPPVEKIQ